jgi:small subunit ribosomal protein S1
MKDKRFDDDSQTPTDGEEDFAALLEQSLGDQKPLKIGQKIQATILQIGPEWVFLDVGQKGEGVLAAAELCAADGQVTAAVGEVIGAYFLSRQGGELRFTTRMGAGASGAEHLEEAYRSGIPVEGRIEKEVKGGFEVRLPGTIRAFCPFSQAGLRRQDTAETVIGQSLPFRITQFDERGRTGSSRSFPSACATPWKTPLSPPWPGCGRG